ncbi:hypothetical protein GUJ93_ZPchr0011g27582 [Zizania palustris]|uniref:DUF4219 domain-containing protein n=1 Tax=Zizania palustris TaxID=103762 RepID=A0A8J6BRW9_ZIZPA|nr:hypothetical protein GUJ93_ZPchr0011g27582 [Zizania palustris]
MPGKKVDNNTSKDGVVIQRVTREVGGGGTSYPVLTKTNYSDWALLMKVKFKACALLPPLPSPASPPPPATKKEN